MIIGLPKEIKDSEFRVGIVPSGIHTMVLEGLTFALTNVTLPYARQLANRALSGGILDPALRLGINTHRGQITCEPVAQATELPYQPLDTLM